MINLSPDNEVGTYLMNPIQHLEVVVNTIIDIVGARFIGDFIYRL